MNRLKSFEILNNIIDAIPSANRPGKELGPDDPNPDDVRDAAIRLKENEKGMNDQEFHAALEGIRDQAAALLGTEI